MAILKFTPADLSSLMTTGTSELSTATGMDPNRDVSPNTGKSDPFDDPAAIGNNPTESNGASASPTMNRTATSRTNNIRSRQTPSRGNFGSFTSGGGGSY